MWKGRYIPDGSERIGKNGAIPEPEISLSVCLYNATEKAMGTSISKLRVLLHSQGAVTGGWHTDRKLSLRHILSLSGTDSFQAR